MERGLRKEAVSRGPVAASLEDAHRRQHQRLQCIEETLQGLEDSLALPRHNRAGLLEVCSRVEAIEARLAPSQDVHAIFARLGHQDEELRALRALSDAREAKIRKLEDSLRDEGWERKLEELEEVVKREAGERARHLERVEHIARRVERQELSQELLRSVQEQLWWHSPEPCSPRTPGNGARAEEPKPTSMYTPSTSRAPSTEDDERGCSPPRRWMLGGPLGAAKLRPHSAPPPMP